MDSTCDAAGASGARSISAFCSAERRMELLNVTFGATGTGSTGRVIGAGSVQGATWRAGRVAEADGAVGGVEIVVRAGIALETTGVGIENTDGLMSVALDRRGDLATGGGGVITILGTSLFVAVAFASLSNGGGGGRLGERGGRGGVIDRNATSVSTPALCCSVDGSADRGDSGASDKEDISISSSVGSLPAGLLCAMERDPKSSPRSTSEGMGFVRGSRLGMGEGERLLEPHASAGRRWGSGDGAAERLCCSPSSVPPTSGYAASP